MTELQYQQLLVHMERNHLICLFLYSPKPTHIVLGFITSYNNLGIYGQVAETREH